MKRIAPLALTLVCASCNVLQTGDSEGSRGRGATAFDPYSASASGAIKLSLQMLNGCAVLANGTMVAKGNAPVSNYPETCVDPFAFDVTHSAQVKPTGTLEIMTDTNYFLNQLTFTDVVSNLHTNTSDLSAATGWITRASRFKNLDWRNLGQLREQWMQNANASWNREVLFGNAEWMSNGDDAFLVEVIDSEGSVRTSVTYSRKDFLGQAPAAGHTRVSWRVSNILPPQFPGDTKARVAPATDGPPAVMSYRTMVRMDLIGSTNPFKTFKVAGVTGEGAIRVTWSQLPNEPFEFPVRFVDPKEVAPTCFTEDGQPVACGFGLDPRLTFSEPENGLGFYEPGETFHMFVDVRDGDGNRLHPKDSLPSFAEMYQGKTNGLLYYSDIQFLHTEERDVVSSYQVAGPIQDLRTVSDPTPADQHGFLSGSPESGMPFFSLGNRAFSLVNDAAAGPYFPGLLYERWPTRLTVTLPEDARPGTYVALLKIHRQFMGERDSKTIPFQFQVGQSTRTNYPGRVGNCQICHRSVLSLDNLRHGLSVDHVESCKVCHSGPWDVPGRVQVEVHQIHMTSPKFKQQNNDCTMCHLTRESALRPSIDVCSSCHPSAHGSEYFQSAFTSFGQPNRFGNCAETCHAKDVPRNHILPQQ